MRKRFVNHKKEINGILVALCGFMICLCAAIALDVIQTKAIVEAVIEKKEIMTYANLFLVIIGIGVLSAILGSLVALTDDKVRQKIRLSPSLTKKRKHLND